MWTILCYGGSFLIYLIILLWGLLNGDSGDLGFGHALFSYYFILPVTSFIGATVLSVLDAPKKWIYPLLFGSLGFLIAIVVAHGRIPQIPWWLFFVPGIAGTLIGRLRYWK